MKSAPENSNPARKLVLEVPVHVLPLCTIGRAQLATFIRLLQISRVVCGMSKLIIMACVNVKDMVCQGLSISPLFSLAVLSYP